MNKVLLIGRLVRTPELKQTSSGIPFSQFTLATERLSFSKDRDVPTDFISCVTWRELATILVKYKVKGDLLFAEGYLETREYEGKDGSRQYQTNVVVETIKFLGGKTKDNNQDPQEPLPF